MMKDRRSSETPVLTRSTRRNNPEDGIFHRDRRGNLKSYKSQRVFMQQIKGCWKIYIQTGDNLFLNFIIAGMFNLRNPCNDSVALGSSQPLTEVSTRDVTGVKARPAPKADNLGAQGC
jgi:hypothetical protein